MANLNLLFLGVLVLATGGSISLVVLLVSQHEITVHRRPRVILAFVIGFITLCVLLDGGITGLAVCLAGALCFFFLGRLLRIGLLGADAPLPSDRLPRPPRITRWRIDGIQVAKLVAFFLFLAVMLLAFQSSQLHLQSQQPGPSYLDLIDGIESDID
jgi:hypothetical protein